MAENQESLRKTQKIIEIIAKREPFIAGFCRRFANELTSSIFDDVKKKVRFLLGYGTLPTLAGLYKNVLLTKQMVLFIGRCLKKRRQQNRRLAMGLMFEFNCYQG